MRKQVLIITGGSRARERAPPRQMTGLEHRGAVVLTMFGVIVVVFAVLGATRLLLF